MSVLKYKDEDGAFHKVPLYGAATWSELQNKPFTELDAETLAVTDGKLAVIGGGSEVSISQALTEGTEIGTITIDGTDTKLYAPIPGDNFTVTVVETLPESGENEKFYLVPASNTEENNSYDEYVWVEDTNKFELVGSTSIDLSDYAKTEDIKEVSATQTLTEGTEIGSITIGETETKLYAPAGSTTDVGSVARKETVLWSGSQTSTGNLSLNESLDNFDEVEIITAWNTTQINSVHIFKVEDLSTEGVYIWEYQKSYLRIRRVDENTLNLSESASDSGAIHLIRIIGVSYEDTIDSMYVNVDSYSEEEQIIGSYLGKPLYRKIWTVQTTFTLKNNAWTQVSEFSTLVTNNNIENLVSILEKSNQHILRCSSTDNWSLLASGAIETEDIAAGTCIILEYTKTTDEENSFSADSITSKINVKGIGYENYSEDEIVIGKWIDGRPIYKRTIVVNKTIDTSWVTIYDISKDNIDNLISINEVRLGHTYYLQSTIDGTNLKIAVTSGSVLISDIIIEYTKTTDAENSFTPSMVASGITETKGETTYTDDEVSSAISTILGGEE